MTLREYIENEIRSNGPMPFSRYMEICLYGEPGSPPGFYTRQREQFGKAGDFYTSSDVHAVFGRLLARQFEDMWRVLERPAEIDLIELGPGRGLFAQDVLDWAEKKYPEFASTIRYRLVETSASLRKRLGERFADRKNVWVHGFPSEAFRDSGQHVIVFGNEFFDAIPTEVLDHRGKLFIDFEDGRFTERFQPPAAELISFAQQYAVAPQEHERVDVPLRAQSYMSELAQLLRPRTGFAVIVDYGYVQEEMFAGRHLGTVTAFRQHTISDSPYDAPGEQDITVHVNFTALAAAARSHGLDPLAWVTQSQFLMGIGEESQFAEAFEGCKLPQEHAKRALQLKHLITPEGMGESFHVLLLSSNVDKAKAARVSGLKFLRPSNTI
ncbi:MAG: class I SAM-dependent methyltransferase [Terriglobales bacterium]